MSFESSTVSYPKEDCHICIEPLINDVWEHNIHRFHGRCIAEWVKIHPSCPVCRAAVDTTSLLGYKVLLDIENQGFPFTNQLILSWCGFCISLIPISLEVVNGRSSVRNVLASTSVSALIFTIFVTVWG